MLLLLLSQLFLFVFQSWCSQTDPTFGGHRAKRLQVQMQVTAGKDTRWHRDGGVKTLSLHCLKMNLQLLD